MRIYIDSDSCPVEIREIVIKAANRTKIPVIFVANHLIPHSRSYFVSDVVVPEGKDKADDFIVGKAKTADIVITRDILMAERLVNKRIDVINDRGIRYTCENIRERVSLRNYMEELNKYGLKPESTSRFSKKEIYNFSNAFDTLLTLKIRNNKNDLL